jgi:hypothetical protein
MQQGLEKTLEHHFRTARLLQARNSLTAPAWIAPYAIETVAIQ